MGLKDLVEEENNHGKRQYPEHPREEEFLEWIDEFQDRFPEEVGVDFLEVSPRMTKTWGYAYYREDSQYIRLSEYLVKNCPDSTIKRVILHEMVHLYSHQIGYGELTERDPLFTWVLGRVGAHVSGYSPSGQEWNDVVEPFLEE